MLLSWPQILLLALYALLILTTPWISYDRARKTLSSVSHLIAQHRPLSRFVAGCAVWLLFVVLHKTGNPLAYICWLAAHGIVCFDADTHLETHILFLVLFVIFTLSLALQSLSPAVYALCGVSAVFMALLGLNMGCWNWWASSLQNAVELVWLGVLGWWVMEL
jgi:hypothetical protein